MPATWLLGSFILPLLLSAAAKTFGAGRLSHTAQEPVEVYYHTSTYDPPASNGVNPSSRSNLFQEEEVHGLGKSSSQVPLPSPANVRVRRALVRAALMARAITTTAIRGVMKLKESLAGNEEEQELEPLSPIDVEAILKSGSREEDEDENEQSDINMNAKRMPTAGTGYGHGSLAGGDGQTQYGDLSQTRFQAAADF
ncbi:hypothetical protein V5799_028048 [Amblyomma americanum]|uniref:Secreted protein n=1 Tax=Amblyomma americanum TaxID=6943 RepID=A0AAQ4DDZ5_AMBAM